MKRYIFFTLKVLLISILMFSVIRLASLGASLMRDREHFDSMKAEKEQISVDALQPDTRDNSSATDEDKADIMQFDKKEEVHAAEIIEYEYDNHIKFADFIKQNSDFAGWIKIDGTLIDYPVMFSPAQPDYYLHHDFEKNDSLSGIPYIGKECSINCDNTIIYAHNMKNGTMFAGLLKYTDESFFKNHRYIEFDTLEGDGTYEIIAVFREKVHYRDETDVFRYYNYCGELSEQDFNTYIENIKRLSLYETGKTAIYGQKLITLSTCSYHTENGRFVVVGVKK